MNAAIRAVTRAAISREIDALLVIGGNGSQSGASRLSEHGFLVVGVASTTGSDLCGTDVTIGLTPH